ncbi:phosphoenolpyruvate carboxykinase (ATP) [Vagococcus sp.]|uniref:phosphoenolpyruvate carboxykinase (ATP) n=1 Tax=Vagococcus sp. TaxID=1933889 RepID=UPI003F9BF9C2
MSSTQFFKKAEINKNNPMFSDFKTTIETFFYGNNVEMLQSLTDSYKLAAQASGTIVTDLKIESPEELGLPHNAKVLVHNDGAVVGRTAAARRVIGQPGVNQTDLLKIVRSALFNRRTTSFIKTKVVVGLDQDFMLQSHLILPKGYEATLYSYNLNFQYLTEEIKKEYTNSKHYDVPDLYIYGDPDWTHPDYPQGLAIFDPEHNVAAILGLPYFGEFKKATLTLAWASAHRNGYTACHGGMKQYLLKNQAPKTIATFGLSGSGKSTLTLSDHQGAYMIKVLHDDAFIINQKNGSSYALEPSYFDKTQDYPSSHPDVDYFLTCQNIGVTLNEKQEKVLVTEDIRNGNGRTVKSRLLIPNRVNKLTSAIDMVFFIMKDDTLPPVIKIKEPYLAASFGATLATKRSSAENIVGANFDQLVYEPFANPFRVYPLIEDYQDFLNLFDELETQCFVINTDAFGSIDIGPEVTLDSIAEIVENKATFKPFGKTKSIDYLDVKGYEPNFSNPDYLNRLNTRLLARVDFLKELDEKNKGYNALPLQARTVIETLIDDLS